MKKILVVDDSAFVRKALCGIINKDPRFEVAATARDGVEALDILTKGKYDAMCLDVNMPKMDGLELLREMNRFGIKVPVMMISTDTDEGASTTVEALELGAVDFVKKPSGAGECMADDFAALVIGTLATVVQATSVQPDKPATPPAPKPKGKPAPSTVTAASAVDAVKATLQGMGKGASTLAGGKGASKAVKKIVAIASSTGGPKALQSVIPKLPANLDAPVLLVQHMPKGFTASLAERLDAISPLKVKEAAEGDVVEKGYVYIAAGGMHMTVQENSLGKVVIRYGDWPNREGVKPCANYMYESLAKCRYEEITCAVMTGMGADGTEGITNLKKSKPVYVIAQEESTCAVYGMPRSIVMAGLADTVTGLETIANAIVSNVGVK